MTALLWVGMGVTFGACTLHAVLGAMRPVNGKHASFAVLTALQCVYFYFQHRTYEAQSMEASVAAVRVTTGVALGMAAVFPWFACACTGVRVRRTTAVVFWAAIVAAAVYDAVSPYGIYFGSAPRFTRITTFTGEVVGNVVAPFSVPLAIWIILTLGVVVWGLGAGVVGRRRRQVGPIFLPASALILVAATIDLVRDLSGGNWPYLFEYAITIFALAMSVDLAVEHRSKQRELAEALTQLDAHAARLEQLLAASMSARDKLNTPLQSLELGLALLDDRVPDQAEVIGRLRRAVTRLTEISRRLRASPTDREP